MFNIFTHFVAYLHIKIKLGYAIQDVDIMKKKKKNVRPQKFGQNVFEST